MFSRITKRNRGSVATLTAEQLIMIGRSASGVSRKSRSGDTWQCDSVHSVIGGDDPDDICQKMEELLDQADKLRLANAVVLEARRIWRRLTQEIEAKNELIEFQESINPVDLERVLARA